MSTNNHVINVLFPHIFWPNDMWEKDINDMVINGHKIMNLLESNTYKGLEAKVKFNNWKKV